jgi:hypothetical protein
VRSECGQWLAEIDELTPSIVVSAQSAAGADLSDVHVLVDGEPAAHRLDGREIVLDPGPHKIHLRAAGFESVDMDLVLREREKARPLAFKMRAAGPMPRPLPPSLQPAPTETRPVPLPVYVLVTLGVVALGSFTVFGLLGRSEYFDLKSRCGPSCTSSDVTPMRTKLLVADVSLGVSIVSLAGAMYFLLTRPVLREAPRASAGLSF